MHQEQINAKKVQKHKKEEQLKETEVSKMTPETEAQKIARIKKKAQKHGYPKGVIELLDKNAETVDFVADYEQKKDNPVADTIGVDLSQGGIPELLQWDERWGYAPYFEDGSIQLIQPDIGNCGGLTEAKKNMRFSSHL